MDVDSFNDASDSALQDPASFLPSIPDNDELEPDEPEPGSLAAQEISEPSHGETGDHSAAEGSASLPESSSSADDTGPRSSIPEIQLIQDYIAAVEAADINNGDLSSASVHRLLNPPTSQLVLDEEKDRGLLLSLRQFLAHANGPENGYAASIRACKRAGVAEKLYSLAELKGWMSDATGVIPIVHDMCPASCQAYTGPLAAEESCRTCKLSRYIPGSNRQPRQTFHTIPLAPVVQSMHRDPDVSKQFQYGAQKLEDTLQYAKTHEGKIPLYDDILCGRDILRAYARKDILPSDILLMGSYDGCQIYHDKQSDCWIYIWVFISVSPDKRYKKRWIIPGGFIPGPNKPKFFESFIFPGLHHIAAVNKLPNGGLPVWHADMGRLRHHRLYFLLATADGPAMTNWNGLVGHSGRLGCRFHCKMPGRHKGGQGGHHYPCMLKPTHAQKGSDHPDIGLETLPPAYSATFADDLQHVIDSPNPTVYAQRRAATGISKPSILSGLGKATLGVPQMCSGDIMHLVLNLGDLLTSLWRGTIDHATSDSPTDWRFAVLTGATWERHGADVAACTPFLPSSLDRAPRNPAEKINSGYKQWEFLIWLFCLAPALLYKVLPDDYWKSFCKLVRGIRLLYRRRLTPEEIKEMDVNLREFMLEFERLYYERNPDRVHFVRQSIHVLCHYASEAARVGPGICSSQFPMERTIGILTGELRLHTGAVYANLSQRGLLRSMLNALLAMCPEIQLDDDDDDDLPANAIDSGNGYVLLGKRATGRKSVSEEESKALYDYVVAKSGPLPPATVWAPQIMKWARLRLPNGQIARSVFKECGKSLQNLRNTRNVKVCSYL
ncbi:hypothetical protein EXIGLDRAFT_605347 [Exidia glandulosa HHB12029]|uniref:Uncharacterized protein n=1 Tax=Exidia glandulosa HHB12029 TaxID=1314781 RepID=A0A165MW55_EXIGL|nr:hypothetical protein EXIGLDRAFT_605347 [Exidia glandulosa HHB12029]